MHCISAGSFPLRVSSKFKERQKSNEYALTNIKYHNHYSKNVLDCKYPNICLAVSGQRDTINILVFILDVNKYYTTQMLLERRTIHRLL